MVERWLDGYDGLKEVERAAGEFVEGTREKELSELERLLVGEERQRVVVVQGPFGIGKSCLLAQLCAKGGLLKEHRASGWLRNSLLRPLSQRKKGRLVVGAAHFFLLSDDDAEKSKSLSVCLYSIAHQLCSIVSGLREELEKIQDELETVDDLKTLFRKVLVTPLQRVNKMDGVVVVLDGMEALPTVERQVLLEILREHWEREMPSWISVVVSSRPVREEMEAFKTIKMEYESEENKKDLEVYLKKRMEPFVGRTQRVAICLDRNREEVFVEEAVHEVTRYAVRYARGFFFVARRIMEKIEEAYRARFSVAMRPLIHVLRLERNRLDSSVASFLSHVSSWHASDVQQRNGFAILMECGATLAMTLVLRLRLVAVQRVWKLLERIQGEDLYLDMLNLTWLIQKGADSAVEEMCHRCLDHLLSCQDGNDRQYRMLVSMLSVARVPLSKEILLRVLESETWHRACEVLVVDGEGCLRYPHQSMSMHVLRKRGGRGRNEFRRLGNEILVNHMQADVRSAFALRNLVFHLCQLQAWDKLKALMFDFDWLCALVSSPGTAQIVINDIDTFYNGRRFADCFVTEICRVIETDMLGMKSSSEHELAQSLLHRIRDPDHPVLESLMQSKFQLESLRRPTILSESPCSKVFRVGDKKTISCFNATSVFLTDSETCFLEEVELSTGNRLKQFPLKAKAAEVSVWGNTIFASWSRLNYGLEVFDRGTGICLNADSANSCPLLEDGFYTYGWFPFFACSDGTFAASDCYRSAFCVARPTSNESWRFVWRRLYCTRIMYCGETRHTSAMAVGAEMVATARAGSIPVVDVWVNTDLSLRYYLLGHKKEITGLWIDGDLLVSGSLDKTVRFWDLRTGDCTKIRGHKSGVLCVTANQGKAASASEDGSIRVWNRSGTFLHSLETRAKVKRLAMNESIVVGLDLSGKRLTVWKIRNGEEEDQMFASKKRKKRPWCQ